VGQAEQVGRDDLPVPEQKSRKTGQVGELNMGASKKEIIKGVFKSYSSLLPPIVIGLVGGLLFIPTQLMNGKLQKQIRTKSISKGDMLRSLSRNAVSINQWKEEEKYQQDYERDADDIDLITKQCTQRQLLSYEIFPEPKKDASVFIFDDFGRQFRDAIERLIDRVNAGNCPTQAELDVIRKSWSTRTSGSERILEVGAAVEDDLCREKAEEASVYIDTADLGGYNFWGEYKYAKADSRDEAIKDCWYYQLGYWIIEDVIDTVAACNSGSNSVFESSVKRLLEVSFRASTTKRLPSRSTSTLRTKGARRTTAGKPAYVLSVDSVLTKPCTRRICNNDIDVVHFKVAVVVNAKEVLPFMRELCGAKQHRFRGWDDSAEEQVFWHNQITILEYEITSVDREDIGHEYYRYGEDAVVKLDLSCEYIFNKNGYDEVKPEAVKQAVKKAQEELEAKRRKALRPRRRSRPKPKKETKEDLLSI
jgi:hypothetical protein